MGSQSQGAKGITLGEWVRLYGLEPFPVTATEIAYGVIARTGMIASPETLGYLKRMVKDEGIETSSTE